MASVITSGRDMQGIWEQIQTETTFTSPEYPATIPASRSFIATPCMREQLLRSGSKYQCICYRCVNNIGDDDDNNDDDDDDDDDEDEDAYEYLFTFDETPEAVFKACRRAFNIVNRAIKRHGLARRNPAWYKTYMYCLSSARANYYYPELSFGTQTICWLGMQLAGGSLDILKDHIEGWRVKSFGHDMLTDILVANAAANARRASRTSRASRIRRARRIGRRAGF